MKLVQFDIGRKSLNCISMAFVLLCLSSCEKPEIRVTQVPKTPIQEEVSMPPAMQALPGMEAQVAGAGAVHWSAPDAWQATSGSAMRKGSWKVETDDASIDISVTAFPGDVGGDLANVNRWLQQIQAAPIDEQGIADLKQKGARKIGAYVGYVMYLEGAEKSIYGAVLPRDGYTWFFKMTGDKALVSDQRKAMDAFLSTVHFHHEGGAE